MLHPEDDNCVKEAAAVISSGGLLAIPTETVYGLGANAFDDKAVARIFEVKGRAQDNPLIIHVSGAEDIEKYCCNVPETAYILAHKFWPGPLTMVLYKKDNILARVSAGLDTVAVRCPESEITRNIIRTAGVPIAAPSANISGKPSTTSAEHVLHDMAGKIEAVVDGGKCRVGLESTIVDLTVSPARLLRPGGITAEQLKEQLGELDIDPAVERALRADEKPRAPGMKYRHYAPEAKVIIVRGSREGAAEYINRNCGDKTAVLCYDEEKTLYNAPTVIAYGHRRSGAELAENLFSALRELDSMDIDRIYARCPENGGVAFAVRNRLQKAAGYNIVQVDGGLYTIGITGGSGAGKTTLLEEIKERGALVIDCDEVYHELICSGSAMLEEIAQAFPGTVKNNVLDRKALGAVVFDNEEKLARLNEITHKRVGEVVDNLMSSARNQGKTLAAIDAIALIESGLADKCDIVIAVTAPEELRVERLIAREDISREYALKRIAAQKSSSYFKENCDYLLENKTTDIKVFREECKNLLERLIGGRKQ